MDTILISGIIDALAKGDLPKLIGFALIFIFLWIEVRGMKKQLTNLNENIAKSFKAGEARTEIIEKNQMAFEHRLSILEHTIQS